MRSFEVWWAEPNCGVTLILSKSVEKSMEKSTSRQLEMKELTNAEICTVVREEHHPDYIYSHCRKWVEMNAKVCDIFQTG